MQLSYGATAHCLKEVAAVGKPSGRLGERQDARPGFVLWLKAVKLQSLVGNKA